MTVKIVFPKKKIGAPTGAAGTRVLTESGEDIQGITRIEIDLNANSLLTAKITVDVSEIENAEGIIPEFVLERLKDNVDLEYWSCKRRMSRKERAENDGFCPECNSEIELDE